MRRNGNKSYAIQNSTRKFAVLPLLQDEESTMKLIASLLAKIEFIK